MPSHLEQCAGQCDALPLPSRQQAASLAHNGGIPAQQRSWAVRMRTGMRWRVLSGRPRNCVPFLGWAGQWVA